MLVALSGGGRWLAQGADLSAAQKLFLSGQYPAAVAAAEAAAREGRDSEDWQILHCRALLMSGRYADALKVATNALARDSWSIRLKWQAREVFEANGDPKSAAELAQRIVQMMASQPRAYRDAASLVVFGQAALLAGADPKRVMDTLYEPAKKSAPKLRDIYLASGGLALDKHDYALAAKRFEEGLKELADDPDLYCGLARAYEPGDQALMLHALESALARNSNHVDSLLLLVNRNIDAEDYAEAGRLLDRVEAVNPWHPRAWAYRAVLAHFRNEAEAEKSARAIALKFWASNPLVDHVIGLKLSQHYRFNEGAAHQREALILAPDYLPAKAQLSQDLLRLGQESEGWALAEQVHRKDEYDVEAYNLVTLRGVLGKYATVTNGHFVVRMKPHEASVYGQRVLALLERARSNLVAKYGAETSGSSSTAAPGSASLAPRTLVELFGEEKDFAVRTFGMPGNSGYLGVCFGTVITANSPAARPGGEANWEAMLWHEFCHVITLQLTGNKIPRWLSEGISVYEERQADLGWGERMQPAYREMLLGDDFKPLSELSGAFLSPPSEVHLQFAYYESSLAVEFIVQQFGLQSLKSILRELGCGVEVNQAIAKHTQPMAKLEPAFAAFARKKAEALAPGLDWEKPPGLEAAARRGLRGRRSLVADALPAQESWESWSKSRTNNFWVLTRNAGEMVEAQRWADAKPVLRKLVDLYPDFYGPESPYRLLAKAHRGLGETNQERAVLTRLAERDGEALDAYRRLMELGSAGGDWKLVLQNAERHLAVNPLVPLPYRFLAQAGEQLGQRNEAVGAYRALLELEPPDPAETHYRLARLLDEQSAPEARLEVLKALEDAPRYQAAQQLLLKLVGDGPRVHTNTTTAGSPVNPETGP